MTQFYSYKPLVGKTIKTTSRQTFQYLASIGFSTNAAPATLYTVTNFSDNGITVSDGKNEFTLNHRLLYTVKKS
jgi:hypothetical protein